MTKPDGSLKDGMLPLPSDEDKQHIFRWFFFIAFAILLYQLLLILSIFSDVIIWAASLTLVFMPIHKYVHSRLPHRRQLSAALSTVGVLFLVLLPILILTIVVVEQSTRLYPTVSQWIIAFRAAGDGAITTMLPEFIQPLWQQARALMFQIAQVTNFDIEQFMLTNVDAMRQVIADFGTAVAGNILLGILNLVLIIILMFFCFRDGEVFLQWLFEIVPMSTEDVRSITVRVFQTVNAVIRGALFTAAIQGLLAIIGYVVAGVPLAVFFGVLTGFAAMIPVIGAGLIWAPIAVFMFLDRPWLGIFVAIWGFFVVSLTDNILKPIIIGSKTRMPILLVFCGIIGGVNVYGVTGVIIGPILIAVLLAFITIYRDQYLQKHGPVLNPGAADSAK